jgi:transposase-like protein
MVRNEEKYQLATHYRKSGFTYAEIAKICEVSPSTLSSWFSKQRFSKRVLKDNVERSAKGNAKRMGMLNKARKAERTARYSEAVRFADTEYKHYKKDPLFTAGLMIYLCDGDKADFSRIRLSNKYPPSHKIFHSFLISYLGIEKTSIQFWLLLPLNIDEKVSKRIWNKTLSLPQSQFGKTQVLKQPTKGLHNGTGNTIIGNTVLKCKLNRWLELSQKELSK